jgi:SH3 domain-containing protein
VARLTIVMAALLIAACGSGQPTIVSLRSPVASATRGQPSAAAQSPSPATVDSAMQVAIDGAVRQTGATYLPGGVDPLEACPQAATKCLSIQSEVDGVNAAYFRGRVGNSKGGGECFIYTIQDPSGWHFLDMACAHAEGGVQWPDVGSFDYVFNTGNKCANVRANPGLTGKVVGCLKAGTTVNIDGGPNYVIEPNPSTSHLWWHLAGTGWMAHEYLVLP